MSELQARKDRRRAPCKYADNYYLGLKVLRAKRGLPSALRKGVRGILMRVLEGQGTLWQVEFRWRRQYEQAGNKVCLGNGQSCGLLYMLCIRRVAQDYTRRVDGALSQVTSDGRLRDLGFN